MPMADHKVFCTVSDVEPISIVAALSMFSTWAVEIPPTGATGDLDTDRRLSRDFNTLAALNTQAARFRWIEAELAANRDPSSCHPSPDEPKNLRNAALIRWWLDIFNNAQAEG